MSMHKKNNEKNNIKELISPPSANSILRILMGLEKIAPDLYLKFQSEIKTESKVVNYDNMIDRCLADEKFLNRLEKAYQNLNSEKIRDFESNFTKDSFMLAGKIREIATIRERNPKEFEQLLKSSPYQDSKSDAIVLLLSRFSSSNSGFATKVNDALKKTPAGPAVADASVSIGDITPGIEYVNALHAAIAKKAGDGNVLKQLQKDAACMHSTITPSVTIFKDGKSIKEEKYVLDAKSNPPDAIFIFGNNDLRQVDHMADIYHDLAKKGVAPRKIYISGLGGHGTSPGPIFGKSEADTMAQRLIEQGIPSKVIVIENKATNSGANIKLTNKLMNDEKLSFKNILISGTPAGILRQARSYEHQATKDNYQPKDQSPVTQFYDWQRISTCPPTPEKILKQYYSSANDAAINIFALLREVGSFLDYTVNSTYMSSRPLIDEKGLTATIRCFTDYYNMLTNQNINGALLARDFIAFTHQKAESKVDPHLKNMLSKQVVAMANHFRLIFNNVELQWMKQLSKDLSLWSQSAAMDKHGVFSTYNLDPPKDVKTAAQKKEHKASKR